MCEEIPPPENVHAVVFAYFGVLAPPAHSLGDLATAAVTNPAFAQQLQDPDRGRSGVQELLPLVGYALDQQTDAALDDDCHPAPAASVVYDTLLAACGEPPAQQVVAGVVHTFSVIEAQPVDPDAVAVVRGVRDAGMAVGVIVNCVMPPQYLRDQWAAAGVADLFDAEVFASEWGWFMPHPSVFREVVERLDCPPEEVLVVCGEFRTAVQGAETTGLRTVWVRHDLPDRVQQVDSSYVVRDLEVLLDWFGGTV